MRQHGKLLNNERMVPMTLYEWLSHIAGTKTGAGITIDLREKTMRLGDKPIVYRGELFVEQLPSDEEMVDITGLIDFSGYPYAEIERLFLQFHRSVPSKRETLNRGYFKALSSDSMTMYELENNIPRREARLLLEGFILLMASQSLIPWTHPEHFFWKGTHPCMILYRDWILTT